MSKLLPPGREGLWMPPGGTSAFFCGPSASSAFAVRKSAERQGPSGYTSFAFQRPRRNSTQLATARVEKATVIATNTPRGPQPNGRASA
jgi:hypothetical protein